MARKILLFALLAAHAALLSAIGEDEVGSGDGSGSGDRCRMSDPLPEPLGGGIVTAGDLEPRCHLACIEKISLQEGINLEDLVSTTYPVWPMIPYSSLHKNCTIYKMVELCRESCSLINLVHCRNKCVNETYDTPDSSACQVCRKDACDTGCEVKQELQAIDEEGTDPNALPPAPNGRLELTIADASDDVSPHTSDAGLYTMDPSGAVPQESNSSAVIRHPTVIILRVSGRKHKYVWLTSFEEILNLTAYACEEVRIQLGAINKFGLAPTSYSPHTSLSVEVYGESLPTCAAHPKNVNFIKEKVNMTGYWKHANVIVHWKRREKGFELLDHYEARFQLEKPDEQPYCRPTNLTKRVEKRSITGDDLRWNISAGAVGDGPVSDCHYTVTIEAVSLDRSICPTYPPDVHKVHISSLDTTPVPLDLQWGQEWDDKTGNFTYNLDWSMPDDTNVQRAVGSFEVLVDLIAPDNTYETLSSTVYFTNASSGLAYHHTQRVKYDEKNFKHQITLKSHPGDLSLAVLIPSQRKQTFSAEALPPAQVVGVTAELITPIAESKTSTVTLDIAVAWGEVEAEVAYYQLRVARDNTTGSTPIHEIQPTEPTATISGLRVALGNCRPCLYIQVKAVTHFMAESPWSDAFCLELPHFAPTTSTLPSTVESNAEQVLVSVSSITATSISLSWSVSSWRVASWEVVWRPTDRGTESTSGPLSGTTYTIHQLDPSTIYTLTVRATNAVGTTDSTTILFSTVPYNCDCKMATELESLNSSINFHSFESGNTAAISGAVVIPVAVILTTTAGVAVIVVVLAKNNRNTKMKTGQDGREGDYDAVPFPREGTGSFQPSTAAAEDSVVYETV